MASSSSSDNQSPYGFFFSVYKCPEEMQAEEEIDDEFTCTTVLMRLWKQMSDDSDRYELAGSCECPIWQDEVAVKEQSPILTLETHLTDLGIVLEEARREAIELVLGRVCMEDVMGKTGMWVVMDIAEDWYDMESDDSDEESGMVPASEAAIAALEKVEAELEGDAMGCCAICMEEDEERLSRTPCRHVFHTLCIQKWLRISSSCPTCRFAMPLVHD